MFQPSLGTHFNHPFDRETLQQVRAFGFRWARIDAQGCDAATQHQMIADAQACGLIPLVIVYDLERLRAVPPGVTVEWGNEPDGDILPAIYRARLNEACRVASEVGVPLWAPAISNLDKDSLRWMEAVRGEGWPPDLSGITVHRYGDGSFDFAHPGFADRDAEVEALLALCDGLPWMVTEFGYPTDPGGLTEEESAANIALEWEFWRQQGCEVPFLYQLNDGPHPGEAYGIRRCDAVGHPLSPSDPTAWKPAAYQVPTSLEDGMNIAIGCDPFPSETMRAAKSLNAQGDGTFTISNLNDTIMSVNSDGTIETRPPGANGAQERCTRQGNVVYFRPDPTLDHVYAFAFAEAVWS